MHAQAPVNRKNGNGRLVNARSDASNAWRWRGRSGFRAGMANTPRPAEHYRSGDGAVGASYRETRTQIAVMGQAIFQHAKPWQAHPHFAAGGCKLAQACTLHPPLLLRCRRLKFLSFLLPLLLLSSDTDGVRCIAHVAVCKHGELAWSRATDWTQWAAALWASLAGH
jgi:hypothetical protein